MSCILRENRECSCDNGVCKAEPYNVVLSDLDRTMMISNRWHMIICAAACAAMAFLAVASFNAVMTMDRQFAQEARV